MKKDINKEKKLYEFLRFLDSEQIEKAEELIDYIKDPKMLLCFAIKTKKRLPWDKEAIIVKNPVAALIYVKNILKKRWEEAEKEIFKHEELKFEYYRDVLNMSEVETAAAIRREEIDKAKTLIKKEILKTAQELNRKKFSAKTIKDRFEDSDVKVKEITLKYKIDNETLKSILKDIAEGR